MPRLPKPYFRRSHGTYHATIAGRVVNLRTADPAQAWRVFCERQAAASGGSRRVAPKDFTYFSLACEFLDWSERNRKPATYQEHARYCGSFAKFLGDVRTVESIIPNDLTEWLDQIADGKISVHRPTENDATRRATGNAKPFRDGGRRAATVAVKRSLNWASEEGLIDRNPLARVKVKRSKRRGRVLNETEQSELFVNVAKSPRKKDKSFQDFLNLALETGMRPDEIYRLEARHVHGGRIIFEAHEAKGGRERKIVLTGAAIAIVDRLAKLHPAGPLLRNSRGEPWTREAISSRLWRLKRAGKLPPGISAYSLRHSFATSALMRGVHPEELRHLLGHASLEMIARHYSHLDQADEHLRLAVERATRKLKSTHDVGPTPNVP